MIPGKIFARLAKFQGIVGVNDFWFPLGFQELLQASLGLLGSFCFSWAGLYPLCCQILYHHGISMIVPRFTFFTENFVICSNSISDFSALGMTALARLLQEAPCYFGHQAYCTIWVLRKVRKYTVLTRTRFHVCSRLHWEFMR